MIKNKLLVLDALTQENYQLIDEATGLAPKSITTKRQGQDLIISLNDGDNNPDIQIKNYYDANGETTNVLTGQHENGKIYAYMPASGNITESINVLAEEVAVPQALGEQEIVGGLLISYPWWLATGAALTGVAVAASSNGSDGSTEKSPLEKAKELVAAAENADKAAKEALEKALADGISAEEAKELLDKSQLAAEKKVLADEAVKNLLQGTEGKEVLQDRVDALTGIVLEGITDKDNDDLDDAQEKAAAEIAVREAEAADRAAKDELKKALADSNISEAEAKILVDKSQLAAEKKSLADAAVKALPEGLEGKDALQGRVDALDGIAVKDITDKDNDGIDDAQELAKAKELVKAAKEADNQLKATLAEAEQGGISPEENKLLTTQVTAAKDAADAAVKELPVTENEKADLQKQVKELTATENPIDITDQDGDGKKDSDELVDAQKLVVAAEEADANLKAALLEAEKGGISEAEKEELTTQAKAAKDAKDRAMEAVNDTPDSAVAPAGTDNKAGLVNRIVALDGIKVPTDITDQDGDGKVRKGTQTYRSCKKCGCRCESRIR